MTELERRRDRSPLATLDNALLVVVCVAGALLVLGVVGVIVRTVWFLLKVAVVAVIIGLIVRAMANRR